MRLKAVLNATIVTCSSLGVIKNASMVWDSETGKIVKCCLGLPDVEADIFDCTDCVITPGFIDAHTHIGIQESIVESAGDDLTEFLMGGVTPFINAFDAINFDDAAFNDALSGGVTTVGILTGSFPAISGTGCIVKTFGNEKERVISRVSCLKGALGEVPKFEALKNKIGASTRGGNIAIIRDTFYKAAYYNDNKKYSALNGLPFLKNAGYENIQLVIDKKIPFRIHAFRSDDIVSAARLSKEFDIDVVIEHGLEAAEVLDDIKDIPVFYGTALSWRYSNETKNTGYAGIKKLCDNNVKTAIITDHGCTPIEHIIILAQLAVKEGVSWEEGIKLITLYPAEILNIDNRVGALKPNMDADFNIFSGDPFCYKTKLKSVFINGKQVWNILNKKRWY